MKIENLLMMTEKEVKKYIKSCGIEYLQELYRSKDFIDKLNLENCKAIRTYHRSGLKVSIFYEYTNLPGTPDARINLRIYPDSSGKINIVHWEECGGELLFDEKKLDYFGEEFYIWSENRLSNFKTPWKYIEEQKRCRENLEPLLGKVISGIGEELDDYLLLYAGETIDKKKNNFIPCCLYSKMVIMGSKNNLDFENSLIPFILDLAYSDCGYFKKIKDLIGLDEKERRKIEDYIDSLWIMKDEREKIRKLLLQNSEHQEIIDKIVDLKIKEYKETLNSLYIDKLF